MLESIRGRKQGWLESDIPDQTGRRVVVTGANAGIGFEATRMLAEHGATVVMAVRDESKGEAAAKSLGSAADRVQVAKLDVSDLESVRAFAADLDMDQVDVLINNAGVMGLPFTLSAQNHELHFATNFLGHFLLVDLLLEQITDRVVVTGSVAHRGGDLDLEDLDWEERGYSAFAAYQASKLANLLHLGELSRRLTAQGSTIRAVGAHPGSTATEISTKSGNGLLNLVSPGHRLVGMTAAEGALTTAYAATMDVPSNTYIGPDGYKEYFGSPTAVGRATCALDPEAGKELWTLAESLVEPWTS